MLVRRFLLISVVFGTALALASPAIAAPPTLISVSHVDRHPSATWALAPGVISERVEVATSPATSSDGYFLTENVKAFNALLEETQTNWVYNYQLEPGLYYVHIGGLDRPCYLAGLCPSREWSQIMTVDIPPPPPVGSFVLRAGANSQRVGPFRVGSDPTYRGAIGAFDKASRCRLLSGRTYAEASWRSLGLTILLVTYGGMPQDETGCTRPDLINISSIHVTGPNWHTVAGLKVGQSGSRVRRLYPHAIFNRREHAWWLVHVRERCVIGTCDRKFETVPRLKAKMRRGRVASFVFPVGAQGE